MVLVDFICDGAAAMAVFSCCVSVAMSHDAHNEILSQEHNDNNSNVANHGSPRAKVVEHRHHKPLRPCVGVPRLLPSAGQHRQRCNGGGFSYRTATDERSCCSDKCCGFDCRRRSEDEALGWDLIGERLCRCKRQSGQCCLWRPRWC